MTQHLPPHDFEAIDYTCRACAHMHRDREGKMWCQSPETLRAYGHAVGTVWERSDPRCAREGKLFKNREGV